MAKQLSKVGRSIEIESKALEEYFHVRTKVLGTKEWLTNAFLSDALEGVEVIEANAESIKEAKKELSNDPWLGVDTETTGADKRSGLNPLSETSRLLLLQLGTPKSSIYLIEPTLANEFKDILESPNLLHIGQNLVFDFKYLLVKYDIHIENMYDTMLAEQLLTSGKYGLRVGLADISRRYPPYRLISKETRGDFIEFKGKFTKEMVYYAARDITLLFPIITEQKKLLSELKMETVAQDEFNIIPCTAMMELGGVTMSPETLRLALSYWEARRQELEEKILDIYDKGMEDLGKKELSLLPNLKKTFNLDSPAKKLQALQDLGFDIEDVQRDTLKDINSDITNLLAEYSETTKVISTYGENLIARINAQTGKIHPEFNQLGAGDDGDKKGTIATGRYSSDFQQLPKPVERYAEVKDNKELIIVSNVFRDKLNELEYYGSTTQSVSHI